MSKRKVFGRIKNVEVGPKYLYTFELIKSQYELSKCIEGNVTSREIEGRGVEFSLAEDGLEVQMKGERGRKLIPWASLANLGKIQPTLFV